MKYKIPINIIELENENYHLIVHCKFNDGTSGNWIVDTGASKSVFDKNREALFLESEMETEEIHSAGIQKEPLETSLGHLHPFSIKNLKIENMRVALIDLSHINELYAKATNLNICGLIGGDFLKKYKALIDYKKSTLVLMK